MDIRTLNAIIYNLKEKYTKEINEINYFYWPVIAKLKKKVKYSKWLLVIASCLLFSAVIWIILQDIVNEYWIGLALTIGIGSFIASFWYNLICCKKLTKTNEVWNKALKRPEEIQIELMSNKEKASKYMIELINDPNKTNNIGTSYEEILEFYNYWVEQ